MDFTQDDIFAIYKLPDSKARYIIIQDSEVKNTFEESSLMKKGFVLYPFCTKNHTPLFINADKIHINKKFTFTTQKKYSSIDISFQDYLKKIAFFIEEIKSKEYRKIVLSRTKTIDNNITDIAGLFRELEKSYPNAMVFLVNHPLAGTWMGATPEILIEKEKNRIKTMALAGTQFVQNAKTAKWEYKEKDEQKAVMDYIENIFTKNNIRYDFKGPYTKIAAKNNDGYLIHLATEYNAYHINNFFNILMSLHPTPAVGGLPKKESIQFILQNEGYDRKYYTGFLGPVNIETEGSLKFYVNLRSMEVYKNKFLLYLGGGLNKDSIPHKEWEETENKAKTLNQIIAKSK